MEYVELPYDGFKVIFLVENNLCNIIVAALHYCILPVLAESLKDLFYNLHCWFYTNKLPINVKKSNFTIFRPRQNMQTLDLGFNISNYSIDRVKEATFLGVILAEHLTWQSHIHI